MELNKDHKACKSSLSVLRAVRLPSISCATAKVLVSTMQRMSALGIASKEQDSP